MGGLLRGYRTLYPHHQSLYVVFRAEGIAFSLYDKQDTCHLQYPEEPQRNTAALFAGRDPARTLDICTTPSHAGYASIRIKGGWRIVIGPVYNARLNESLVDAFMAENQIPAAQRHAADTILEAAPNLSLLEFSTRPRISTTAWTVKSLTRPSTLI